MLARLLGLAFLAGLPFFVNAKVVSYEFDIAQKQINITGTPVMAMSIGGQIPAPTLEAEVGDTLRVTFHNRMQVETSVHWHGILLPSDQDGVPHLNTHPMPAGTSFTFEFPILQSGTYWYHSHTGMQIQSGIYGPIVLHPAGTSAAAMQEETLLISDWTDEDPHHVLVNLKKDSDFYAFKKDSVQSWDGVLSNGAVAIGNRLNQSATRMGPMDLADVGYDAFLINGQRSSTIAVADPGQQQVLLRLINGSTSSYFDVEYAGGDMTVIAADGQDVEILRVRRLRISTAETYDVLVPVTAGFAYELRATSIDGSGFGSAFIGVGQQVLAPDIPLPNLFLMQHDGEEHSAHSVPADPAVQDHSDHAAPANPDASVDHSAHSAALAPAPVADDISQHLAPTASTATQTIAHMLDYQYLIAKNTTALPAAQPWREITLELTGNMERYQWSFNGKSLREDSQILIRKGENVRFVLSNSTMMRHPMHLHGHFFRVVNQHGDRSPLKHTVNVESMSTVLIEFDADNEKDWMFHCHNQFHMETGMNRVISYMDSSQFDAAMERAIQSPMRWFNRTKLDLSSNFTDVQFRIAEDRHDFGLEIDADFVGNYEATADYVYHLNRFLSTFVGMETRRHEDERRNSKAIAGFKYMLPLLVGSEWRVDDAGDFRLELNSQLSLSRRIEFNWRWNTDDERRYQLNYHFSKQLAVSVNTDSEYGDGIGFSYLF